MNRVLRRLSPVIDLLMLPLLYPSAWILKQIRRVGIQRLPRCRGALLRVGIFPIRDHYYEPQFDHRSSVAARTGERYLPAIDWNVEGQLAMLATFDCADELLDLPREQRSPMQFFLDNRQFGSGDAEYWYQLLRAVRPSRIVEIGSGNSTLMAIQALEKNRSDDPGYSCEHICIEPYEMPWLEQVDVSVVREKVEDVDPSVFAALQQNDILFIDSSHMIRPGGDVLFEYLQLLPALDNGVIVHVHDIFSPRDYPASWLEEEVRFWNEQYLVEAFLSFNRSWRIVGALNYLKHNHYDELKLVAPHLSPDREPGSLYIQKIG